MVDGFAIFDAADGVCDVSVNLEVDYVETDVKE